MDNQNQKPTFKPLTLGDFSGKYDPPECMRGHRLPTVRCAHLGNRFVIETRTNFEEYHFIDYVEDIDDQKDVVVESNYVIQDKWEEVWNDLNTKMLNDITPFEE